MVPETLNDISGALVSLLIGTLLGTEITRFLYRPKVRVRYSKISPLHVKDGTHWSINVANLGRTVASNCKAVIYLQGIEPEVLLKLHEANPNEFLPSYSEESGNISFPRPQSIGREKFRPIAGANLAWAKLGNPDSIDINPGVTELLDICKVQDSDKGRYVIFPTELGWRRVRCRIRSSKIAGKVLVCPSNEFPTVLNFELDVFDDHESTFKIIPPGFSQRLKKWLNRDQYFFE